MYKIERFFGGKNIVVKEYHCDACSQYIGFMKFDLNRTDGNKCFKVSTIMGENYFPDFCPFCGHKLNKSEMLEDYVS